MQITFNLPHVFIPGSTPEENAAVLDYFLELLVAVNLDYRRRHPLTPRLYESGVRYGRTQEWDPIPALYARRYGDCKSLTAALVAEYRERGIPARPFHRWNPREDGNRDFHILMWKPDPAGRIPGGVFEDPSKVLGMGADENVWFRR